MEPEFWHSRWQEGKIGFHEGAPNPFLTSHAALLGAAPRRVFVPLCGKSRDMAYLASLGHEVVGVELSPLAAEAFFAESGVTPERSRRDTFEAYSAGGVTILVGDVFDTGSTLGAVDAVYDRAAVVALPPDVQERYARHLVATLPPGAPTLLVTFEYDTTKMTGPPFSVPEPRVRELFGDRCTIEKLGARDVGDERPVFKEASAIETAWLLTVK